MVLVCPARVRLNKLAADKNISTTFRYFLSLPSSGMRSGRGMSIHSAKHGGHPKSRKHNMAEFRYILSLPSSGIRTRVWRDNIS